ncbi:MAG: extracellular solute-binding protein [Candidatus Rokubacteria bacterium]|nr:extracellular solute-binding protein [Candidatus Rokubacteria bacterium]MBI4593715.1 extracellular solute-binding protein [Candidatus Rokubacteria bacterium]
MMRTGWIWWLSLPLAAVLLTAASVEAQDARLEAAKKEGKVVWYTGAAVATAERVAKLFEQTYPGVKVEVHRSGSERILQRLMQEAAAGIKNCDVFNSSDAGHYVLLRKRSLLARYAPAGAERFPASFRDPDGFVFGWRAFPIVMHYNSKLIAAAEAPKSWKDLLDPKWKGKLVTAHPGYSGSVATYVLALVNLHGWDYFKQLAQQKPLLVQSVHDPAQVVAAGERPVGANGAEYFLYTQRKKGNPIGIAYPADGVPLVISPTAITSFAPHPQAARLFTDFIFTREVQQLLADAEGLYVPYPDVTYPADKPKLSELKVLAVDPEELERRTEEIKKRFVELFGA